LEVCVVWHVDRDCSDHRIRNVGGGGDDPGRVLEVFQSFDRDRQRVRLVGRFDVLVDVSDGKPVVAASLVTGDESSQPDPVHGVVDAVVVTGFDVCQESPVAAPQV
jgi:hypothetical protein